jgi:hypothetical protein
MRRYVAPLAAAALACGMPLALASSASAFGAESLGCYVSTGGPPPPSEQYCTTSTPARNYNVTFSVANLSGSYTYSWTVPSHIRGLTGQSGCTSTSSSCSFGISAGGEDIIDVSVVVTQAGQSETLYSEADVPAVCGNVLC